MARAFDSIRDINDRKELWKLAVKVESLWTVKRGKDDQIEFIIRDVKGDTIHVTITPDEVKKRQGDIEQLKKLQTQLLHNFRVQKYDVKFKWTEHPYKLMFVSGTKVYPIDKIADMPVCGFKFKPLDEIIALKFREELLVDVIGVVDELGSAQTTFGGKLKFAFTIKDLSSNVIDCCLWDNLASQFVDFLNNKNEPGPIIVIIKHARLKHATDNYPLQITNAWIGTFLILNDDIPAINQFKNKLPKDNNFSTPTKMIQASSVKFSQTSASGSCRTPQDKFLMGHPVMKIKDIVKLLLKYKNIDECKTNNNCITKKNCRNKEGGKDCICPDGQPENETFAGGCQDHRQPDLVTKIAIGTSAGLIVLFVAISSLYLTYQKRKLVKLKQKFFQQNGGSILLQQLSTGEDSSQSAQIFTEEELKKATKNYDESLIIGRGGFGTVFKGILSDNKIVAVKKSKIIDANQIEQFINEVVVLSQINHRNVVKLLGCCLETEVPSLVYEFVSHGTLFDFLQSTKDEANNPTWKTRLRIAAETAGALSYLHSSASIPIIHRDVKSTNILLDENYTAKVSDFGASRLVPLDQTEIATMVQGTLGYLDPEYMQTHQLTEKSDVYSYGVVLAELLTGDKPLSFNGPDQNTSLAMHFLSRLKQDRIFEAIQVGIMNDENKEEIKEVAILAARCLRLIGEERPSMKEMAMELEGIRLTERHPWNDTDQNFEENQRLLHEASSSIYNEIGDDSSNFGYTNVYDSLKDQPLISLDDGR